MPEEECQAEQGDVPCEMSQAKLQHPREMTGDRLSSSLTRLMAKLNRGEQSEKRDVMGNNNPESKHDNEKTGDKPLYEKPEWRDIDVVFDIIDVG